MPGDLTLFLPLPALPFSLFSYQSPVSGPTAGRYPGLIGFFIAIHFLDSTLLLMGKCAPILDGRPFVLLPKNNELLYGNTTIRDIDIVPV